MYSYHVITFGCQMNQSDSERIASALEKQGYKLCPDKYQADLVVVNTCGVRQSAENRIYGLIPGIKKRSPKAKIIVTGCLVHRGEVKRRMREYVDMWLPINEIFNFPAYRTGRQLSIFKQFSIFNFQTGAKCRDNYLRIKPKYGSRCSALVPIGNGCNNFCSYCVVPYARGREIYRSLKDILAEVRGLVKKEYKEIILIAQNVNSYKSGKTDFSDLLKAVDNIKGDFWIRFFTCHPKDMSDKLIKTIARCEKVCHQIHLPAQAGDDGILQKMNRQYTALAYVKLVEKIKQALDNQTTNPPPKTGSFLADKHQINSKFKIHNSRFNLWDPPAAVTTDIIVGFPGETRQRFANSVRLFKQIKFDMAYISEYSGRPGTAAYKLVDNVPPQEKRKRKNQLDKILRQTASANNKKYLKKTVRVLVENQIKPGEWFGKTATGKDVKIKNNKSRTTNLAGKFVEVKIIEAREFCLAGILMNHE